MLKEAEKLSDHDVEWGLFRRECALACTINIVLPTTSSCVPSFFVARVQVAAVDPETSEEVLDISEGRDLRYEYEEVRTPCSCVVRTAPYVAEPRPAPSADTASSPIPFGVCVCFSTLSFRGS